MGEIHDHTLAKLDDVLLFWVRNKVLLAFR
jgi:hypothetical protein